MSPWILATETTMVAADDLELSSDLFDGSGHERDASGVRLKSCGCWPSSAVRSSRA
jgi:hypothetical protein